MTFYTIYKITHEPSKMVYIGMHKTDDLDDGYMGSGKLINRAMAKHCISEFTKEILYIFNNEDDMSSKEAELVTEEFCAREDTYNICPGGKGGWGYVNSNLEKFQPKRDATWQQKSQADKDVINKMKARPGKLNGMYGRDRSGENNPRFGATLSDEIKEKISKANSGKTRSEEDKKKLSEINKKRYENIEERKKQSIRLKLAYSDPEIRKKSGDSTRGTFWFNNGIIQKRCKESPDETWVRGRLK